MIVNRDTYIDQLIRSKGNGLIKIVTIGCEKFPQHDLYPTALNGIK